MAATELEGVFLAVRAVLDRSGKLLLLQRGARRRRSPTLWEVPGGLIGIGERIDTALKREVKEETGLVISPRLSVPLTFISPAVVPRYLELIFRCRSFRGESVSLSDEHQDFRWVTVEEALDMDLTPTASELMEFLLE